MEQIFKISIELHGEIALEKEVIIDTTVQEKNITFPTDTKLRVKMIDKCWKLADDEGISLRRSYRRELRETLRVIRFSKSQKDKKKVRAHRVKLLKMLDKNHSKSGIAKTSFIFNTLKFNEFQEKLMR